MKKLITILFCFVLLTGLASINSCKKDNSHYEGQIVFWYDQTASAGLIADGATALTFYLSTQVVGSTATSLYWATAPSCGLNGSVTVKEDLGNAKTHAYSLSVKDQTGFEYWTETVNVDANTCTQFQLVWSKKKK
jgi:hypothetical protein